jgi:hypothetical protein
VKLWPNIGPLDSAFPLFADARLRVVARGRGTPVARTGSAITIEVANTAGETVEIVGVCLGYRYTNPVVEALFGKGAPRLPLRELRGAAYPPFALGAGESATLTANLDQFQVLLGDGRTSLGPHSRFLDPAREDPDRLARRGRAEALLRNLVAGLSHRRLAAVVEDDRGTVHKAKVRWQAPGGMPPNPHALTGSRV